MTKNFFTNIVAKIKVAVANHYQENIMLLGKLSTNNRLLRLIAFLFYKFSYLLYYEESFLFQFALFVFEFEFHSLDFLIFSLFVIN